MEGKDDMVKIAHDTSNCCCLAVIKASINEAEKKEKN